MRVPVVSQVLVIGDRRKYSVLLVVPNFDHLQRWARANGPNWTTRAGARSAVAASPKKMEEETLGRLTGLASFETPKRVGLLERVLSIEAGEPTPTLKKIKRHVIERDYKALIDSLYDSLAHSGTEIERVLAR